jgi:hypothetical protein
MSNKAFEGEAANSAHGRVSAQLAARASVRKEQGSNLGPWRARTPASSGKGKRRRASPWPVP